MANELSVAVPDIGDFEAVDVIDVLVKPGDVIHPEDPLVTLESEKATMDIPAPQAGKVVAVSVKVGDKVSQGNLILTLAPLEEAAAPAPAAATPAERPATPPPPPPAAPSRAPDTRAEAPAAAPAPAAPAEVRVPDIGDFEQVDVIDVLVKIGDVVGAETPLITLESEKATMDIPSPGPGRVLAVLVKVGDKVSEGHPIVAIEPLGEPVAASSPAAVPASAGVPVPEEPAPAAAAPARPAVAPNAYGFVSPDPGPRTIAPPASAALLRTGAHVYASPAMRRFARELGVDLAEVKGSGRKGRIVKEDVAAHVKAVMQRKSAPAAGSLALTPVPAIDFSRFGAVDTRPLSKIRRLTGQNLHRAWVTIPHVTQFDDADITELEAFRKAQLAESEQRGVKLTLVAFLLKAVTAVLQRYPDFNTSLTPDGESLVYKQYCHVGVAVNTSRGLLVPVIRNVDTKGVYALAQELRELSLKARDGKLTPAEMQGGCFTITSLGGVSGTGFTPIINPPEVAILGISPAAMKPVYRDGTFVPRLMLPLSLSYDHRVIDGVAAAEFTRALAGLLGDIRQLLL
ncbi:MAG: dihydrolipoyllysine-residue acetyltransferase [Gammaproteobacteria bacterium]